MNVKLFSIKFCLTLIGLTPLIDTLNGYVAIYHNDSGNFFFQSIRLFLFALILFSLSRLDMKLFLQSIFVTVLLILITFVQTAILLDLDYFSLSLSYAIKVSLYFSVFNFLGYLINKKYYQMQVIKSIRTFSYLMPIVVIIPNILGISRSTYGSIGVGNAGLFIANNASGIALIISTFILLLLSMSKTKLIRTDIIFLFFCFIALYQQSLRSGYMIIILGLLLILGKLFFASKKLTISKLTFLTFLLLVIFLCIAYIIQNQNIILSFFSGFNQRQEFLSTTTNNSILGTLTSGRIDKLFYILNIWPNFSYILWIIGVGQGYLSSVIGQISEMDFFDMYFYFGIIGWYVSYFKTWQFISGNDFRLWTKMAKFLFLLSIFYSLFGGHVYWEIISSTSLIMLCCIARYVIPEKAG
ncbi:O-antigen ligase family protein [Lactococcus lactis]|uniref:Uncharacterized protein n=2 Tax=Lactococcus lactis subsp. lactis TaxID=1360 RepID=A0AAJ4JUQ5_LACLL|nr:hypothetical protein [Lactococcus lactis]QRZ33788.1 hypothetical protein LL223_0117 [Lactococcus lactis subsp. lactis]